MTDRPFQAKLIRWYNTSVRRSFMLAEDTYEHWALLAADEGSFRYQLGEEKGSAKFGEIVLCPPGVTLYRQAEQPLSFLFIEFGWTDEAGRTLESVPDMPAGKISFRRIDRFSSTFSFMRAFADSNTIEQFAYKQHLLMDLLYLHAAERRNESMPPATNDPAIRAAVAHIQNHACEPLSLQLLAKEACLSQSQFSRRFQTAMGSSPIVYLTGLRMRKARSLLVETDFTLEQIAQQCGYQNGFYLSRVFTKTMNMSPSEFRRTHRV